MPDADPRPLGAPRAIGVPDVAAYLLGTWTLDRELTDRRAELTGTFRGTATFRPLPLTRLSPLGEQLRGQDGPLEPAQHLEHVERGELVWAGARRIAERTLRVEPLPDGTAQVRFADGRVFHDLDLRTGTCVALHPCAADRYTGTFTIESASGWAVRWDVVGPAKDQTFTSRYRRT